jgi:DNA-binding YbaB/EbfC family protein|tara:strand:- start:13922 stop:14248 length:327 start_codon:yes stop_codon:yes gene_type:complete
MDNLKQLMQLGQQMQEKMKGLQDSLDQERITSSSGGGMVKVTVDGKGSVKLVKIDPTCVDPDDVEMLEDLVLGALSDAQDKAQSVYQRKMRKATGGFPMNIPGLPKLF